MAWYEVHQSVWTHRKTYQLAERLDLADTYAASHVVRLWGWSLDNAPDGDLSALSDRVIALGAGWPDDPRAFVQALIEAGWLDEDRKIHDWMTYAGRLIERRRADAERQRLLRERQQDVRPSSTGRPPDAPATSGVPDSTGPDSTVPDPGTPPPAPPVRGRGAAGAADKKRRGGSNGVALVAATPDPAPASDADRAVWHLALERMPSMTPGNRDELERLEPIGRTADGGLCLRAPPLSHALRFRGMIAVALHDAGDVAAGLVSIVETPS